MRPADCKTMTELRSEIDRLDRALVALLAERAAFIDRAAAIKAEVGLPARIEARVEEVVANVRAEALRHGLPCEQIETIWRSLIDWSIAREDKLLSQDATVSGAGKAP